MSAKPTKKKTQPSTKPEKDIITETSIKVGKALARTSIQAEKSTNKVKKMAEELLESVGEKVSRTKNAVAAKKKTAPAREIALAPASGLSVEGHLGFLAGDLYQTLKAKGDTAASELVNALRKRGHTEAMIYAAMGWLAREGQVTFTPDGKNLTLR
ncbi:MAG: winged helix-turn-helix domain-containing protein [Desulfobulbaceae bacterium]|nr:winged helix-turn-helix domain-containing protein [Desulfobulbaceae bacterium]